MVLATGHRPSLGRVRRPRGDTTAASAHPARAITLRMRWSLTLVAALPTGQPMPHHLRDARWLLEEYRVSLFAQQLGTATKVSDQRIRKVMARAG